MTSQPPSPLKGARIGDYQVLELLGQGGFGEVWSAQHVARPERVAIKILHVSTVEDSTAVQRFLREASASEAIGHPNVIKVFDTGVHEGRPYLVMELLEGQTLRKVLQDPTVTTERKLELLEQMLGPLDAAHQRGFVHRDLKPSNVMVTAEGVKLLDFGLARSAKESGLTMSGTTLGTPYYTSPEAARSAKDATPAADVWAIGCMLHEVFTGERTFQGKTAADVLIKLCTKDPPPLPENVPKPWARLVFWCLEKQPAKRPQDAGRVRVAWRQATSGHMPDDKPKDMAFASTVAPGVLDIESGSTDLSTAELGQMGGQQAPPASAGTPPTGPAVGAVQTMASSSSQSSHMSYGGPPQKGKSKLAVVLVLALAGLASAALVFFVLSGMNPPDPAEQPAPVASAAPTVSEEVPEGAPAPQEGQVRILSTLEGADFFVDAQPKGPLEDDMTFVLSPGTHQLEARRGDRVLASTPVEIDVGEVTEVTLGESQPVQIRRHRSKVRVARNDVRPSVDRNPDRPTPMVAAPSTTPSTTPVPPVEPAPTAPVAPTMTTVAANAPQPGVYPTYPAAPVMAPVAVVQMRQSPNTFSAPPTEAQLRTRLRDLRSRVQACTGDFHGQLETTVRWDGGSGRVNSNVGRGPSRAARQCVQRVINQHAGLRFPGGRRSVRFTFRL